MKGKTAAALTHGEDFFVFKFDQKDETKRETTKRARKGKKKKNSNADYGGGGDELL